MTDAKYYAFGVGLVLAMVLVLDTAGYIPWIMTFDYQTVWAMATGSPHPETMVVQLKYGMMT